MSTEDEPKPVKAITQSGSIERTCAARCGAVSREPAFEDKEEKDPAKRIKPVAPYPYICLACWLVGWRSEGPVDDRGSFRIYNLEGRDLPCRT